MRLQAQRPTVVDARAPVGWSRRTPHQSALSTPFTRFTPRPSTRLRCWRPFPREVADVICGEGVVAELPVHTHDALQVMLPSSRFAISDGERADVVVRPGQLHVAAPQESHGARSLDGTPAAMRVLLIAPASLPNVGPAASDVVWRTAREGQHLVVDDAEVYDELWRLIGELRHPLAARGGETRLLRCLTTLLTRMTVGSTEARPQPARAPHTAGVVRVRDHLRAHVGESMSLTELAGVAGLSKYYLLRAFRRAYGVTPHAFQMRLRLALAWRLVVDGQPLARVTYDAGFADQSHLTRRFAATFGLTPALYARLLAVPPGAAPHDVSLAELSAAPLPAA
ncbi:MAG: transcriptional regulator, AraC family [Gemmatimonadetes bacterium]|nr:transcriptional regulator, AraC family [Gemmatimonadota bacterium]